MNPVADWVGPEPPVGGGRHVVPIPGGPLQQGAASGHPGQAELAPVRDEGRLVIFLGGACILVIWGRITGCLPRESPTLRPERPASPGRASLVRDVTAIPVDCVHRCRSLPS
jgi:hypothetical protein